MNNWCYHVLVEDARQTQEPKLDQGEDIAIELHPLAALSDLIATDAVDQALVVSAFYHFERRGEPAPKGNM
jgi:hypothetical protein